MLPPKEAIENLEVFSSDFQLFQEELFLHNERCLDFNINPLSLLQTRTIEREITKHVTFVKTLKDYDEELKDLTATAWINFRTNIYYIDDFRSKWNKRIENFLEANSNYSSIVSSIKVDLQRLGDMIPILQFCSGDLFKEDHWTELLQGKMRLPPNINISNLLLRHFFDTGDILVDPNNAQFFRDLQIR